ncbi:hypothetical protein PPERSA_02929 [Pseudocohnilembus persalinus]|uniref:Uncharacterized protein n=1 Tax=Pseudocohnilembus persalinus TaxID=266149 RepID=A0A0V0QA39_PSEPJ|nr:hypothetical protein PPERSA_02929 [Pseudocohnilembus persalinus]|eukprot:KRW99097.1 hypothetical protein PPERSA_02929 [Pseudocohnilembus persalinus]
MRTRRQKEQKIQEKLQEKLKNEQEKGQEHLNNLQENKIYSQLSQEQAYYDLYDEIEEEIEKDEQKDLQLVDIDNLGKRKNFNYQREKGFVYSKKECNDAIIRIKNAQFLPKFRSNIFKVKKDNQKQIFEKIKEDFQIIYTYAHQIKSSEVNNIVIFSRKIADAYDSFESKKIKGIQNFQVRDNLGYV